MGYLPAVSWGVYGAAPASRPAYRVSWGIMGSLGAATYRAVLRRWGGSSWVKATLRVYSGTDWVVATLRVYSGTDWIDVDTSG